MDFKISICYPNKADIELIEQTFSTEEALDFFVSYPWMEQLELLERMNEKGEDVQYSPSVRFTNSSNNISLETTAQLNDGKIFFSLWFERPVMTPILFGLLGKKEKMKLIEKLGFNEKVTLKHVEAFLNHNYNEVERIMK